MPPHALPLLSFDGPAETIRKISGSDLGRLRGEPNATFSEDRDKPRPDDRCGVGVAHSDCDRRVRDRADFGGFAGSHLVRLRGMIGVLCAIVSLVSRVVGVVQ